MNIVTNLSIFEYDQRDPTAGNIDDPTIKSVAKYKNHCSILAIGEVVTEEKKYFAFLQVDREDILMEIANLSIRTASQDTDIVAKVIKDDSDIFFNFFLSSFNCLSVSFV